MACSRWRTRAFGKEPFFRGRCDALQSLLPGRSDLTLNMGHERTCPRLQVHGGSACNPGRINPENGRHASETAGTRLRCLQVWASAWGRRSLCFKTAPPSRVGLISCVRDPRLGSGEYPLCETAEKRLTRAATGVHTPAGTWSAVCTADGDGIRVYKPLPNEICSVRVCDQRGARAWTCGLLDMTALRWPRALFRLRRHGTSASAVTEP